MEKIKQQHGGAIVRAKKGETANPNGRPKKGVALINSELKKEGYDPVTKADIEVNYMSMLQLEESRLKALVNDYKQPMLVRIIGKAILGNKGFDIIERMLDRVIGKPKNYDEPPPGNTVNILLLSEEKRNALEYTISRKMIGKKEKSQQLLSK